LEPDLHEHYLAIGGFPEYVRSPEYVFGEEFPEIWRRLRADIVDRALQRDLAGLGVDVERIKDLLVYLFQSSGGEFNAEERARDLSADPRSVREWVRLLKDTLLVHALDRYAKHPAVGLRSKPKLFAADPGLVAAFAALPMQEQSRGKSFETAVFRHLREAARTLEGRLTYFRHRDDLEIDFVLEVGKSLIAIEVTKTPGPRRDKVERFRRAARELGTERRLLIHGGVLDETVEGIRAIAIQRFLLDPIASLQEKDDE